MPLAGLGVWFLVTRGSYRRVERVLLVLSLYAVAYVASAIMIDPPWGEILKAAIVPTIQADREYILAVLATVGTTITPWAAVYMQASVAEKGVTMEDYPQSRLDVIFGAAVGNIVSAFIIICTAATLFVHGIQVADAEAAAMALAPVAGQWAEVLFGVGLLGASLLAASVLPLATTYAVCEVFGWERGLDESAESAPVFTASIPRLSCRILIIHSGLPLFPLMWLSQVANASLARGSAADAQAGERSNAHGRHRNRRATNVVVVILGSLSWPPLSLFVGGSPAV